MVIDNNGKRVEIEFTPREKWHCLTYNSQVYYDNSSLIIQ